MHLQMHTYTHTRVHTELARRELTETLGNILPFWCVNGAFGKTDGNRLKMENENGKTDSWKYETFEGRHNMRHCTGKNLLRHARELDVGDAKQRTISSCMCVRTKIVIAKLGKI